MKVKVLINDKEEFISADNIQVNGVSLKHFVTRLVKLENELKDYQKKLKLKNEKLAKTWDKMRKPE